MWGSDTETYTGPLTHEDAQMNMFEILSTFVKQRTYPPTWDLVSILRFFRTFLHGLWSRPYQSNHNKSRSLGRIAKPLIARDKSSLIRLLLAPRKSRRQLETVARP